jgi:para-nitrobenzyl esterase
MHAALDGFAKESTMSFARLLGALAALLLGANACSSSGSSPRAAAPAADLVGTSWRLVQFEGGDGRILTPDDRSRFTVRFDTDGSVSVRLDCNRGRGAWKSTGPAQLDLMPLALTRAMCPQMTLHDQIAKQWTFVRSYLIRDNHLFLSLMADGGIFEFEPTSTETP